MGRAQRRKQERVSAPQPLQPTRSRARAARRGARTDDLILALLAPTLIAVVALVLYANSFSIPFLFDDYFEISSNPAVKTIEPLLGYLRRARGIPALTFALNYRAGGFDVWGFHLVNVLVHLANGVLVYALVLRTLQLPTLRDRYRGVAGILAALVAVIFVAHPLQTMAASYIVQRTESIAAFFYLLTLLLFSLASTTGDGVRRIALYVAAALSALLGVVSKEVAATVPLAALAYRLCFLRAAPGRSRVLRLALAALLLLPLAYGVMLARPYLFPPPETVAADVPRGWAYIPTAGFRIEGITPWQYLLTQFGVILWYLRLFVLPTRQCFDYGWPLADSLWRADVLLPLAVLLGLVAAAALAYRRYPLATFCIAWLFITLAPSSSIIPLRDAAFEHRMYLPIVGLAMLVVVGGYDLLGGLAARAGQPAAPLRKAGTVLVALWIALLGAATVARNAVLQEPIAFAADSVEKAPDNWRAHSSYGEALQTAGRSDEAMHEFEEAVRLNPKVGSPRVELGQLYLRSGRVDEAEVVLQPATAELEESVAAAAYRQLAAIAEQRGDPWKAVELLREAVRRKPGWSTSHAQLAGVYARIGLWYGAAGHYNRALRLNSRLISSLGPAAATANKRAAAKQLEDGNAADARRLLELALRYQPNDLAARHYLAVVHATTGAWDQAQEQLAALRQKLPDDALLRDNLQRARDHQPLVAPPLDGS